jgi:monothiol glutaredoxin
MTATHPAEAQIAELVKSDKVVLFMKGNKNFPQCGFSSKVVGMLSELIPSFKTVNVLSDPAIREGVKAFSKWPTIPQLYVNGEFVGGCDIITEMYEAGELQTLLGVTDTAEVKVPTITLSPSAAKAFKDAAESPEDHPRLQISAQFAYELFLDQKAAGDVEVSAGGLTVLLDKASAKRADGTTIDFIEGPSGGFKIENPNEPPRVKSLSGKNLKAMLDRGDKLELFDVRTTAERLRASIGGTHLDEAAQERLLGLDKSTMLVFYCHSGARSRSAAEHFLKQGFTKVFNLEGGIDAWSQTVDPTVPRY